MKKKILAVLMATAMAISLAACGGSSTGATTSAVTAAAAATTKTATTTAAAASTAAAAATKAAIAASTAATANKSASELKIGYISPGPDTWYSRAEEGAKWACSKVGAKFVSVNSNRNSETEQSNIDNLINEGVNCIVILSWNEAGCVSCAEKCKKAGIGCVVFDACGVMKKHNVDITASVDFDWNSMGQMYADWMSKTYPGQDYVFINGTEDSVVCQTLESSMKKATEAAGKNKLVDVRYGQYTPETAANVAEDLVNSGLNFSLIGTINEDCAAAVITRLHDLGVSDKYHVFAQNGSDTGMKLMKEGSLEFTISSSPGLEGAVAVFAAVDSLTNNKTPNQYISCPIAAVTPDKVDDTSTIIPWAVNENAWSSVIKTNFSDYSKYIK